LRIGTVGTAEREKNSLNSEETSTKSEKRLREAEEVARMDFGAWGVVLGKQLSRGWMKLSKKGEFKEGEGRESCPREAPNTFTT